MRSKTLTLKRRVGEARPSDRQERLTLVDADSWSQRWWRIEQYLVSTAQTTLAWRCIPLTGPSIPEN
jgi:hypothetical protein